MTIETTISINALIFFFGAIFVIIASFITCNTKLFVVGPYMLIEALALIFMRLALSTFSSVLSVLSFFTMVIGIVLPIFYIVFDIRKKPKKEIGGKK